MRVRLRPKWSDDELARIYAVPHDSGHWRDHILRVDTTIQTAKWLHGGGPIADLSCGDAKIARAVRAAWGPGGMVYLGDYAPGYQFTGPIEKTIEEIPHVELFILSETIEHLDDPDLVLSMIREKSDRLVLSTPIGEGIDHPDPGNEQHYWGWDVIGMEEMLTRTGWKPQSLQELKFYNYLYNFQIWGCE